MRTSIHYTLLLSGLSLLLSAELPAQPTADRAGGIFATGVYEFAAGGDDYYARLDRTVIRSTDKGASWEDLAMPIGASVDLLEIEASGDLLWGATDEGLYRWSRADRVWRKIGDRMMTGLYATTEGTLLATTPGLGDLERSTDRGESWTPVVAEFPLRFVTASPDGRLWATDSTRVLVSDDDGAGWEPFGSDTGGVPAVRFHPFDNGEVLALGRRESWVSRRESGSWKRSGELPEHDRISAVFADPNEPRALYLGLYRDTEQGPSRYHMSIDSGRQWTSGFSSLEYRSRYRYTPQHAVLVDPVERYVLIGASYATLNSRAREFGTIGHIIRSQPGDIHADWDLTFTASLGASRITSLLSGPEGTVFLGRDLPFLIDFEADDRIFRSQSEGERWEEISIGREDGRLSITSGGTLFLTGTANRLYRSKDRGSSWDSTTFEGEKDVLPVGEVIEIAEDLLLLETVTGGEVVESWISTDGGGVWELVGEHPWYGGPVGGVVDPDGRLYTVAGKIVHTSSDSGRTWSGRTVAGEPLDFVADIVIRADGTPLVVTTAGRLFSSRDGGGSWESVATDLSDTLLRLVVDRQGMLYGGGTGGIIWRSSDDGLTWHPYARIPEPVSMITTLALDHDRYLYAGTWTRGVWRVDMGEIGDVRGERWGERMDLW